MVRFIASAGRPESAPSRARPSGRAVETTAHHDNDTSTYRKETVMTIRVALIAHDHKKDDIVALAGEYVDTLKRCSLVATGTTGSRIANAHGLEVERMLSGPHGGDLQIGAQLAEGNVDMVIFLRDPMTPQPHEPDINALVRACDVHNVPCATNISTARMILDVLTLRLNQQA
jgi:methylglyoxal synthase